MPKKKIAEPKPVVAVDGALTAAPAEATKVPSPKPRARRRSAKAVTDKPPVIAMAQPPAMPAVVEVAAPAAEPAQEEIARLARSYWKARGFQGGSPDADWQRAVNELRSR